MKISKNCKDVLNQEVFKKRKSIMKETLDDLGEKVKLIEEKIRMKTKKLAAE